LLQLDHPIPRAEACVRNADDDPIETGAAEEAPPSWRILVAEDNPLNQQVIARQLAALGFSCDIVADGREAFRSVMSGRHDVVLMDLQMPVLDGLGATRLIRQWEKEHGAPPVRIVAVTASGSPTDRLRCIEIGMDDHLPKPLRMAELSSVLSRLLDSWSPAVPEIDALEVDPALDHSMIEGLRALGEDDGTFFRNLVRQFRADGDARLARLEQAAKDGETSVVRAVAHALCGSSANIGAVGVAAACRAIEALNANDDASHYRNAVRRTRSAYERVLPLLDGLA
jgi:CheY-like chemotaxis protein/HPt (histidine-containing phosphotransfer) domain-containing protein